MGHSADGNRTDDWRTGKHPFFQGKDRQSQIFNELDQPIRRKDRGSQGYEHARRTFLGPPQVNEEQPPEAEECNRSEGSHRNIGGSDAREERHPEDPARQAKEPQRGGGRSEERRTPAVGVGEGTKGPVFYRRRQVFLLSTKIPAAITVYDSHSRNSYGNIPVSRSEFVLLYVISEEIDVFLRGASKEGADGDRS